MEALGKEPDPEKMPLEQTDFPVEVQMAFFMHSLLPERWEGTSGSYLGKDWSPIGALLEVYDIENRKEVLFFLKYIDLYNTNQMNNKLEKERKKQERRTNTKPGEINVRG